MAGPVTLIAQSAIGRRFRRVAKQALMFRERVRFFIAGMLEMPGVHAYHLRTSNMLICMRHPVDSWTFHDIFVKRVYAVPPVVAKALPERPSVLDLGANSGLFGLFAHQTWPACKVIGYEPDPSSLDVLSRNVSEDWYTVVNMAAGASDGQIHFAAGLGDSSHEADTGIPVAKQDVVPILAQCDLAKIDIEGGEWEILQDPRLVDEGPRAIVLEYHAYRSPGDDPRAEVARLLTAAHYLIVDTDDSESDPQQGTVWALRST